MNVQSLLDEMKLELDYMHDGRIKKKKLDAERKKITNTKVEVKRNKKLFENKFQNSSYNGYSNVIREFNREENIYVKKFNNEFDKAFTTLEPSAKGSTNSLMLFKMQEASGLNVNKTDSDQTSPKKKDKAGSKPPTCP
jgi:hypothetical protein